jgi:hypothetical protein
LLSVVTQAFALVVFIYLYAGGDLPPSGDVDESCQWEVQTYEGSVLYWDSQVYVIRGGPLYSRVKSVHLS